METIRTVVREEVKEEEVKAEASTNQEATTEVEMVSIVETEDRGDRTTEMKTEATPPWNHQVRREGSSTRTREENWRTMVLWLLEEELPRQQSTDQDQRTSMRLVLITKSSTATEKRSNDLLWNPNKITADKCFPLFLSAPIIRPVCGEPYFFGSSSPACTATFFFRSFEWFHWVYHLYTGPFLQPCKRQQQWSRLPARIGQGHR